MRRVCVVVAVFALLGASVAAANLPSVKRDRKAQIKRNVAVKGPRPVLAARREFAAMTPEQRRERAEGVYRNTWKRARHLYGKSEAPAPAFAWGAVRESGAAAQVDPTTRQITLDRGMIRKLAKRPVRGREEGRFLGVRPEAQETLLHEWAHVFQRPELMNAPNPDDREAAAELFASYHAHRMFGAPQLWRSGGPPYGNRPATSRALASSYGPGYWRKRQFTP